MSLFQALLLGIVQGVTEFLPISSSGHLILVPTLLGWNLQSLTFDVALHLGTLLALVLYFLPRWQSLVTNKRLLVGLVLGTIPVGVVGLLFADLIEAQARSPLIPAINLILFALVMFFAEHFSRQDRNLKSTTWLDGLWVGVCQAIALIPGVSRSGITISGGLVRHLRLADAAEFSFLLGIPAVIAAGVLGVMDLVATPLPMSELGLMFVGILSAGITGFLVIRFLLEYLKTHSLKVFVVYRLLLGFLLLGLLQ